MHSNTEYYGLRDVAVINAPSRHQKAERVDDKRRRQLLLARKKILQQARIKRSTLLYTHMPEMEESRRDSLGRRKDTRPEEKGDVPVGNGTAACFFEFSLLISVYQTTPDMPRKATGLFDQRTVLGSSHVIVPPVLARSGSPVFHFFRFVPFMRPRACPGCAPSVRLLVAGHSMPLDRACRVDSTYQGLHGAVQGVTVVAAELGVDTLQGGVTVGLGLLDTVGQGYQRRVLECDAMLLQERKASASVTRIFKPEREVPVLQG